MKTWEFLAEFVEALKEQLVADDKRWGDTWLKRDVVGQERRIYAKFEDYWDQWQQGGNPIPWLKIAGLALIAWIRETHPEILHG